MTAPIPKLCDRCGRPILYPLHGKSDARHVEKAVVRHAYYGCDTGCCGHEVVGIGCNGDEIFCVFRFEHDYAHNAETFARSLAAEELPNVPLDWPSCEVSDD